MATSSFVWGYRFGPFTLDVRSGELIRNGRRIRLQEKPRSLLVALAERPGQVITRTELRERLWSNDTFVDFEDGLNTAMRKLRESLSDDPQSPHYVETIRGRGYRLLVEVEPLGAQPAVGVETRNGERFSILLSSATQQSTAPLPDASGPPIAQTSPRHTAHVWIVVLGCLLAVGGPATWYWLMHGHPVTSFSAQDTVVIASFDNQTGDPRFDNALDTALNVSLEQSRHLNVYSHLQMENMLRLMEHKPDERITPSIGREICQRANIPGLVVPAITRTGGEYLITAELIDPSSGTAVRSYAEHAHGEDQILSALDSIATTIRSDLGESRYAIHHAHRPLPELTTASLDALKDYADGAVLFGRGKAADAVRLYQAAVAIDPSFAVAHAALGAAFYSFYFNEPDEGELEFRKALALSSRTTDRERSWVKAHYADSQGRIKDAIGLYEEYLQQYPGDLAVRFNYARLLRMRGYVRESLPIYEQILRQDPSDPGVYLELAIVHDALEQWPQSVQSYEKALSMDPSMLFTGNVNRQYGFALIRDGQEEKAEQVFSAMLTDVGRYGDGERSLAFLDLYRGRYASARQHLLHALARSRDPFSLVRIRYMLAVVAAGQGNRREEVSQLDTIMRSFGTIGQKVVYGSLVGQAYVRAGEVEKARRVLDLIAPMVNDRVEDQVTYIQILKAEVAAASDDYQTALQFLKPPAPGDANSSAVLTCEALAHIYQKMGRPDDAIAWYRQFLDGLQMLGWEPQQQLFDAYLYLAMDYKREGDRAHSMRSLTELLDRWKNADRNLPLLRKADKFRSGLIASG